MHFHEVFDTHICHDHIMNEASYKELSSMFDNNFLRQGQRMLQLKTIQFRDIESTTGRMHFVVKSSTGKNNVKVNMPDGSKGHSSSGFYDNFVRFSDWDHVVTDDDFKAHEAARMLFWVGNVEVFCSCPSFIYYGYKYICTVIDSSLYPENRKPVIRNPGEQGVVCKHLRKTFQVMPFYLGDMATAIKQEREIRGI